MKTFLKSTVAFALAMTVMAAPSLAQDQHDHGIPDQHGAPQHPAMPSHPPGQPQAMPHATPQHMTMQHNTVQHQYVQHQNVQHQYVQHQNIQPQHQQMAMSSHHWQHGQHYNGSRRVVSNWQYYHLRQPPHGYEWVQDGSQFVLIAVASGIIADVIANALSQ